MTEREDDAVSSAPADEEPIRDLEAPTSVAQLYLARGADEMESLLHRPYFTGDVYQFEDGRLSALMQHPCSMSHSPSAVYLAAEVRRAPSAPVWVGKHYKRMFLPELLDGRDHSIEFDRLQLIPRDDLGSAERIAILSGFGVNLLLQRWVHHSTRVVVWTKTLDRQTSGPTEEADLTSDSVSDLVDAGSTADEALAFVEGWFRQSPEDGASTYQDMLKNSQERSTVRTHLRAAVREKIQGREG